VRALERVRACMCMCACAWNITHTKINTHIYTHTHAYIYTCIRTHTLDPGGKRPQRIAPASPDAPTATPIDIRVTVLMFASCGMVLESNGHHIRGQFQCLQVHQLQHLHEREF
jgi:hypothetical protein